MLLSILLLFLSGFTGLQSPEVLPAAPRKLALLIAVGDYPPMGGWPKLSSARDAELLQEALAAQGFKDITVLTDKDATYQGIISAFEKLTKKVRPGDIVFLHYSGHGQQVWDHDSDRFPNRKKDETDGYDEALVPYDAPDEYRPGYYEGENHLVDDELHVLLTGLRQKLGAEGQLIFSVDACYSGTISRAAPGLVAVRGTEKKFGPEASGFSGQPENKGSGFSESFSATTDEALATMVVMSAARADQPNYEALDDSGEGVGSLSLALSRNLMRPFASAPSFAGFFRYITADMAQLAPNQEPQIEGEVEKAIFGNTLIPTAGYPVLEFHDNRRLTVRGGQLAGLNPGTEVRLQPTAGPAASQPLAGKVTATKVSTSEVELEQPVSDPNPAAWQVLVETKFLIFQPVQVALNLPEASLANEITKRIEENERISLVEKDAKLAISADGSQLVLSNFYGEELARFPLGNDAATTADALVQRIQQYTRAEYFRQLNPGASPELEIAVVPVEIEQRGNQYFVKSRQEDQLKPNTDVHTVALGTPFIFKAVNKSDRPLYLNILGVDAGDAIDLLIPDAYSAPAEFVVAPDTTVFFSRPSFIFQAAEPRGKQVFVALATYRPLDLRPVFQQANAAQPGEFRGASTDPESKLLAQMLFGNTRSGGQDVSDLLAASVIVEIP